VVLQTVHLHITCPHNSYYIKACIRRQIYSYVLGTLH